ncbi:hypothetical protein SUGI_0870310 [Cryptomeria japonica]|nr:hypothetical protein SUGI_0870310 [Cryptomeria japonica]
MIGTDKPPFATIPNSVFDTGGTFGSNCQTSGEISKSNMADINSRHDGSSYIRITPAPGVFVPSSSPSNGINFINSTADPVPTSPLSALPREDINSKLPKNSLHSSPPPDRPKTFSEAIATAGITLNSEARFTVNDGTHQAINQTVNFNSTNTSLATPIPNNPTPDILHSTPTDCLEALPTDGFQNVTKISNKRRRKSNKNPTSSQSHPTPATANRFAPIEIASPLSQPSPSIDLTISEQPASNTQCSTLNEISDDYSIAVIPALPITSRERCPTLTKTMEFDSTSDCEDEFKTGLPLSKRRGRPPGSKNKSANKTDEGISAIVMNPNMDSSELRIPHQNVSS